MHFYKTNKMLTDKKLKSLEFNFNSVFKQDVKYRLES